MLILCSTWNFSYLDFINGHCTLPVQPDLYNWSEKCTLLYTSRLFKRHETAYCLSIIKNSLNIKKAVSVCPNRMSTIQHTGWCIRNYLVKPVDSLLNEQGASVLTTSLYPTTTELQRSDTHYPNTVNELQAVQAIMLRLN